MSLDTLPRIIETKDEKAAETRVHYYKEFKVYDTGRGQQVAQLRSR